MKTYKINLKMSKESMESLIQELLHLKHYTKKFLTDYQIQNIICQLEGQKENKTQ